MKFEIGKPSFATKEEILNDYPALNDFNFEAIYHNASWDECYITLNSAEDFKKLLDTVRPVHGLIFKKGDDGNYCITLYDTYIE